LTVLLTAVALALPALPATTAEAATDKVLILDATVTGGASSIEAQEAASQGLGVDVVDAATWSGMTAAQFASYRAIILGDPTCSEDTSKIAPAVANAHTWGGVITGNVVIVGTDAVYHASQGGDAVTRRGVDFAVNQSGKTGAFISLSCYYENATAKTPVPLLDGLAGGGFTTASADCYNSAHIVAVSPALTGISDSTLSGWSCSVHEIFQTWPGALVPLVIARDLGSSFTASDGSQGAPYILAGGNIKSFPLSLSPLADQAYTGGSHTVTAQLLDAATRAPIAGARIAFKIVSGPDAVASGACTTGVPFLCTTGADGQVSWKYQNIGSTGTDTIEAFYDRNSNGLPDAGEPLTTAGMTWTPSAHVACTMGAWPNDPASLTYNYSGGHYYLGNVYRAAANWSALGTKVHIAQWPGAPRALQIPVQDGFYKHDWWGMTIDSWDSSYHLTAAPIYLNRTTMDPLGDFMRTKVATHEMGHAIGLEHPEQCPGWWMWGTKSVMHQGQLTYNTPQAYDKTMVGRLYP
jgi:hypothetical protein